MLKWGLTLYKTPHVIFYVWQSPLLPQTSGSRCWQFSSSRKWIGCSQDELPPNTANWNNTVCRLAASGWESYDFVGNEIVQCRTNSVYDIDQFDLTEYVVCKFEYPEFDIIKAFDYVISLIWFIINFWLSYINLEPNKMPQKTWPI